MRYGCRPRGAFYRCCVVVVFCLSALSCLAQVAASAVTQSSAAVYNLQRERLPIASMDGLWRFQAGDDPDGTKRWASPTLDDSSWQLVRTGTQWTNEPSAAFAGPAWFRARIVIPADTPSLAVYLPALKLNYRLYADGELLGGPGAMPPTTKATITSPLVIPLTRSVSGRTIVIALRVWRWPQWNYYFKSGLPNGVKVGNAALLEDERVNAAKAEAWDNVSSTLLLLVEFLFGMATLALFVLRPTEYSNLWFGIMLVLSAASRGWGLWSMSHFVTVAAYYVVLLSLSSATRLSQIFFYFHFLKGVRDWLFWIAAAAAALIAVTIYPLFFPEVFPSGLASIPSIYWVGMVTTLQVAPAIWVLTLFFRRAKEGHEDARLLLAPVVLKYASPLIFFIGYWGLYGFSWRPPVLAWLERISEWPFNFSFYDLADGLFLITMLAILLRRFVRTAAQEEDHQRERDAAHTVQHLLVPEETPSVPGFEVQSVYLPFGEVGGDFFQVIPSTDSSVLVTIGDVSGKGLPAAMTVALLVGTFRTCAIYNRNPGEILALMNQALAGRGSGGFTTCLVLRADQDGTLTIANAGHLSPYLNGEALSEECELPLGLVEQATYVEASYHLPKNGQLTLLTDGVLEAQSASGELFGFERTEQVTKEPAAEIARSAKEFGQEDDITVLRLVRIS